MDPKKEKWKDEVMGSLEGIEPASPNPFLFAKIKRKLEAQHEPVQKNTVPKPVFAWAIAGLAILISLNVFAITQLRNQDSGFVESEPTENAIVYQDRLTTYADEAGYTQ